MVPRCVIYEVTAYLNHIPGVLSSFPAVSKTLMKECMRTKQQTSCQKLNGNRNLFLPLDICKYILN